MTRTPLVSISLLALTLTGCPTKDTTKPDTEPGPAAEPGAGEGDTTPAGGEPFSCEDELAKVKASLAACEAAGK